MYIPCGQIRPSPTAFVFVLNSHRPSRLGRLGRISPGPSLNARFLIGRYHKLVRMQFFSMPLSLVQVQQPFGLQRKLRVAREDPTAVLPRSDGILVQPTPDGTAADCRHQPGASRLTCQFRRTPAGEWHPMLARQFTRHGLYSHNHVRGKKTWGVQGAGVLRVLVAVPQRSACATDSQPLGAYRASPQSRHCPFPGRPSESFLRVAQ